MRVWSLILAIIISLCSVQSVSATGSAQHGKHASKKTSYRTAKKNTKKSIIWVRKAPKKRSVDESGIQVPAQITSKDQLEYVLNRIIASSDTGGASIGVFIKSLKTGEVLYLRNVYQPLMPASIMKILTAEAALLYLGSDYRFSTQLLTDASGVKNGVLQGNLYIVLSGDPTLVYSDLNELMGSLQDRGITAISGHVYIDNTAYDQHFYGPGWINKDKAFCYGAPISASIINHNCPPVSVHVTREAGRKKKVMTVNFYSDAIANGVVTDIPEYNRALFKSILNKLGVEVYGSVTFGPAPRSLSLIAVHNSDPLPELVKDMLKKSDNVIAGALFKKLGQLYTNRPGSWENGGLAVSQILASQAGVKTTGMRLMDGSGLSVNNLATPAQFMQVLQFAYRNSKTSDHFISALPISGVDGTLKRRMGNIPRRIRAKTGTISGVVSLAGYATSYNKEDLAFVIMINGNKGLNWRFKSLEDKIATAMTRYID
jgi:serine-type D-Ala-D-Ala carboxypeptidase/endopeptidase (penicillin-binding protein 4)